MPVGVIVDVLPREAIPVIDLAFAAPVFNSALQSQRGGIVRLDLQGFLQLLQASGSSSSSNRARAASSN